MDELKLEKFNATMIDKIFNEDCLEGMKRISDGVVDMVLTDLPFGITSCDWDIPIDLAKFWEQINRVTKRNAAIALFANGKYLIELGASNIKNYRYKIVVKKPQGTGFLNSHKMPLKAHEDILIFYRALPTYNSVFTDGKPYKRILKKNQASKIYRELDHDSITKSDGKRYPLDVVSFNYPKHKWGVQSGDLKYNHPTQKPIGLLTYLIKTYTNDGELVLDATIGSGSTAVAAINTNRHFIGFETEKKFCDIANERIAKAMAEKAERLF